MPEPALPVAMVGLTYREAPTTIRSRLVSLDEGADSPTRTLLQAGHVDGIVRIDTCSRTEWVLSAKTPQWAALLLEGALMSRMGEAAESRPLRIRTGVAAVHHLFHVAVGLDSVAEGEAAVGKQLLRAFARSNNAGATDRVLRQAWKQVDLLLHQRRELVPGGAGVGVQSLVASALQSNFPSDARLAVLGKGEIGNAVHRALVRADFKHITWHARATLPKFLEEAGEVDAVVVCTGGPDAWLELPRREAGPWCIDVGSPMQIAKSEGWRKLGLDELLASSRHVLTDEERRALEDLVASAAAKLWAVLKKPAPSKALAAIDAERRDFLYKTLPPLLSGLPPAQAKSVERAVAAFTHAVIRHARGGEKEES